MDIFSFLTLGGGLAFFLYGMNVMSAGLEKVAGGKLESTLRRMTSSRLKSLLLGAGITIAIQSSSAMTVMLVGLVNSGIMELGQTIGLIMGSNIGTTLTAWILSLAGIESDVVFLKLLKPENFSLFFALVGVVLSMAARSAKKRDFGTILMGFAVLMYGMKMMSAAVSPLADQPEFAGMLTAFNNPLVGVLVGAVFTGIIQSSAASVGILQAFALTGSLTYGMAIPIIMGQNIGTCVTALLSSIGVSKNAKRVAVVHISFNILGTILCLILYYILIGLMGDVFRDATISAVGIAFCHSVFNLITTAALCPFSKQLERIANYVIRDMAVDVEAPLIDERLFNTPGVAIGECENLTAQMALLARDTLLASLKLIARYDDGAAAQVIENEKQLDHFEDKLGSALVRLAGKSLTDDDSRRVYRLLHSIGDYERIGDHALNLQESALELHEKGLSFSEEAQGELHVLHGALTEILTMAVAAFTAGDGGLAASVEPLEEVIDQLIEEIKMRHISRLQSGRCTIQLGFILSDVLTNCERVSDHCSNVAVCVLEMEEKNFDSHEYMAEVKSGRNAAFLENFDRYAQKYSLAKA